MGKNQSASNLTNIIKQDANGNLLLVSGSITLMSVSSSGAITTTGNVAGTASYASNAELLDGLDSTVFTLTSSFAAQTASFTAFTSSVNSFSASIFSYTASQNILNGTYATTGSNTFTGIQTVNSNLVVTGSITAQTLVVQTITSSVDFVTGSTRFGSSLSTSTHQFTGSVSITGSLTVVTTGTEFQVNPTGVKIGNVLTDNHSITGSTFVTGGLYVAGNNIGVNTTSAASPLSLYLPSTVSNVDYIKMEMPSWGGSANFKKNIIWHDSGATVGAIGMSFSNPYTYMDFHSFYNSAHTTGSVMRIQGNGNVGIGTTAPGYTLDVNGNSAATRFYVASGGNATDPMIRLKDDTDTGFFFPEANTIAFSTGATERMRIASTGITTVYNTLVLGTSGFVGSLQYGTSGFGTSVYDAGNGKFTWQSGAGAVAGTIYYSFNADGFGARFTIANNGAASLVGALTQNTSDKRLKDNVKNIDNALNKVMALNGVTFDWNNIAEEYGWSPRIKNNDIGVLAQEVQAVLPQAIDFAPFDRDDNQQSKSGENYLTVQYEKIVPLLIEAIKELKAEIEELKNK